MATTPLKTHPKNLHPIFCQRVYHTRPVILAKFARISRHLTLLQREYHYENGVCRMKSTIKKFCQSLTIPCGFTDAQSEVYTNAAMTDILGMTVKSSQVLDVFHAREEVMRNKRLPLSLLSTLPGGYKEPPQPLRFDFFPRFDEKDVYEGAFFYAQPFLFLSLLEYIEGDSPYPVMLSQPKDMFTDREWDVLFLSLQRLTCKEIAKWLDIAIKTVEVHLNNIYRKAEVHHSHQLRQFCQEKRINHYISPQLLPSGCQVISV